MEADDDGNIPVYWRSHFGPGYQRSDRGRSPRQAVRIVEVDGEANEVELLQGRNVGRRGWLKTRHLRARRRLPAERIIVHTRR